ERGPSMKKYIFWGICVLFLLTAITVGIANHLKKLPPKLSYAGDVHRTNDIEFLYDLTYENKDEEIKTEQLIFSEAWKIIDEAEDFILVDMFLFNDYTNQNRNFPDLSGELTHKLLEKREENPDMPIVLITDPINTGYYSYESKHIKALEANNIEVIITDLDKLHDSNKPYTSIW